MIKKITIVCLSMFLFLIGCAKPEEPEKQEEQELITTLKLEMRNMNDSNDVVLVVFKDTDGIGGNTPSQLDSIRLKKNAIYDVKIFVLNESISPADTINKEILERKNQHQFFYLTTGGGIEASYKSNSDMDEHGVPVGLNPTFTCHSPRVGTLKIVLKHQPTTKPRSGNGDINIGDTDVEVIFGYRILE